MRLTEKQLKEIVSKYPKQKNGMIRAKDVPHLFDPQFYNGLYDIEEITQLEYSYHLTKEEILEDSATPEELEVEKKRLSTFKVVPISTKNTKKAICLKLFENDINLIKQQAMEQGLPYQTLLSSLIHQIAHKKIKLTIS